MKAIVIRQYGSREVLESAEVPEPEPDEDDLLVRVRAIGVNPLDIKIREGMVRRFMRKQFPIILGTDFAGEVISVGSRVGDYEIGDRVFEEAAGIPTAGLAALQALRDKGKIRTGMDVLINGAAGGVGHYAVQIAKFFGAYVTAVCSPENFDFITDLGADETLDYHETDFVTEPSRYDIIFDTVGNRKFKEVKPVLQPKGVFITTRSTTDQYVQMLTTSLSPKKSKTFMVKIEEDDLWELKKMAEAEQLRSFTEHIFPFEKIDEAQALSESHHLRGKIIIQGP